MPGKGADGCSAHIIVVGAGLAGTTAAAVLGQQGWQVILVDPRLSCPPIFRAEKIEPDQVQLLRKFGLLEPLLHRAGRVRKIGAYYNGRLFRITPIEQYGLYYNDMVNTLRAGLPPSVQFKLGRVVEIANSAELQHVTLAGGEELTSRLVVLACGPNAEIPISLRLKRVLVQKNQSVAIAFTIARADGLPFPFDGVTFFSTSPAEGIDYLSLFPIGETMRANLFAFPAAGDPWVRLLIRQPKQRLEACLPKLRRAIGDYRVVSKIETARIDLYRTEGEPPPGIVLIGDASQNVCPSTGMGLSKIFTDVDVLCLECVPLWFQSPGMSSEKLLGFSNHPRKRATDTTALQTAFYRRQATTGRSLRWRIHRLRLHLSMQFERPTMLILAAVRLQRAPRS
jgi:2-polyprenyl-6-methoxyphenol hydroxylase-like FAD-dependent oxidoreductase